MKETQKIRYKYDLMHRNTPKFARTTIQWDTKLMTPITRKRVISKLKDQNIHIGWGDAGQMWRALIDKFEVPQLSINPCYNHNKQELYYTAVEFSGATQEIKDMVQQYLTAEIVQHRLEGERWWGRDTVEHSSQINFARHMTSSR